MPGILNLNLTALRSSALIRTTGCSVLVLALWYARKSWSALKDEEEKIHAYNLKMQHLVEEVGLNAPPSF